MKQFLTTSDVFFDLLKKHDNEIFFRVLLPQGTFVDGCTEFEYKNNLLKYMISTFRQLKDDNNICIIEEGDYIIYPDGCHQINKEDFNNPIVEIDYVVQEEVVH